MKWEIFFLRNLEENDGVVDIEFTKSLKTKLEEKTSDYYKKMSGVRFLTNFLSEQKPILVYLYSFKYKLIMQMFKKLSLTNKFE